MYKTLKEREEKKVSRKTIIKTIEREGGRKENAFPRIKERGTEREILLTLEYRIFVYFNLYLRSQRQRWENKDL